MTADYHLHTPLCHHATGTPLEYVAAARARGLAEIGFSDHSPMPEPFDDWRMLAEELPVYLRSIEETRAAAAPFPVRLGLEVDYLPGQEKWLEHLTGAADWDYLIGSVHYLSAGWDFDNPKWIGRFSESETSVAEIWALYWPRCAEAIRSGFFDVVAHPDLVKKFGHRPPGDLRPFYEATIAAAAQTGAVIEVSTAGLRKPVREIYPSRAFLEMAHAAGLAITISSDAHAPEEVGADFAEAIALVREIGWSETVAFHHRQRRLVPLPDAVG